MSEPRSKRVEIGFAIFGPHGNRRIAAADQQEIYQEPRRAPVSRPVRGEWRSTGNGLRTPAVGPAARLSASAPNASMSWEFSRGFGKTTGDPAIRARELAVDSGNRRLAAGNDAAVQLAHGAFPYRRRQRGKLAHPLHGFIMIDGFEMVAQRFPPTVMPCSMTSAVSRRVSVFPSIALDV